MSIKFTSVPTKRLAQSITSSATSFRVNDILGWDGEPIEAADFGTEIYVVFRNATRTQIEIMEIDASTIASTNITITRRGLKFDGDLTTEVTANKYDWTGADTYVDFGTDTPQMFQWLKEYIDGIAIAGSPDAALATKGITRLSVAPASATAPIAVGDNDTRSVPTQAENDAMAGTSGTPSSSNKFVTSDDVSASGASDKIVRASGTGLPVLIGNVARKILVSASTSEVADNTTTETNIFSQTIAGGTLSTNNAIRVRIYVGSLVTTSNTDSDVIIRLKYGSTTLASVTLDNGATSNTLRGVIEATLIANASASAQLGVLLVDLKSVRTDISGVPTKMGSTLVSGTATENSANALALTVSVQWGFASTGNDFILAGYTVELIS